jgi:flagellar protein FliO/FliZ
MIELTVRLIASLAVVVGLLLLTVRLGARRFRPRAGAPLRIVHRQALSRSSSLAVVEVGSRVLVLGTTEQQINVLAELDPEELGGPVREPDPFADTYGDEIIDMEAVRRSVDHVATPEVAPQAAPAVAPAVVPASHADGPLAGSVLSAQTWRDAFAVATGRSR